jgi:hypothetical protein
MKIINFNTFVASIKVNENSDMDFSMHTWGEIGQDSQPPNSGFEGTSGEPMDYTAGYSGENPEEEPVILDKKKDKTDKKIKGLEIKISEIRAMIEDLDNRVKKIEANSKN